MTDYKKNKHRFKSFTDINNYNNFLLELDKKQKDSPKLYSSSNNSLKTEVKNIVKNIDYEFLHYNTKMFTGVSPLDALLYKYENDINPTMYKENNTIKVNEPEKEKENILFVPRTNVYTTKVNVVCDINNINDLLKLIETYPNDKSIEYNINIDALHKIKSPLNELNNMIGMKDLKENIVDQILYYVQNLQTTTSHIKSNDFMHTVIYGPPGTGKTEIAKIIGSIFAKMGILSKGTFKKVTRSDLVAGYLGQTSLKTRDVINECLGGVLFIDEAYALGNEGKQDSFSKECIDTLCEAMSEHKDNLMVIIAGYEKDLNNCFFKYNQGLSSRFTWRFKTDKYSGDDLYKIFLKKVNDSGWLLATDSKIDSNFFEKNREKFNYYGRDIETLFAKTKISHSRRVFCLEHNVKKLLVIKDLEKGLELYLRNEDSTNKTTNNNKTLISSMYI